MTRDYAAPDWRGLCEELVLRWDVDGCDWKPQHQARWNAAVERARAALAQPEPEVAGPTDEELLELYPATMVDQEDAFAFARAVLARWGRPAPAPAEGEVAELVEWLRRQAIKWKAIDQEVGLTRSLVAEHFTRAADLLERQPAPPAKAPAPLLAVELAAWLRERATWCAVDDPAHEKYDCAADLLERQATPVPVAVSERLPVPEDCDAEGRCWWGKPYGYRGRSIAEPYWVFGDSDCYRFMACALWLPAHALPLPSGEALAAELEAT